MEVTVHHCPSGQTCVLGVSDDDTVLTLKVRALCVLFDSTGGSSGIAEAPMIAAHMRGSGSVLGEDSAPVSDTALEEGGTVDLTYSPPSVRVPTIYRVRRPSRIAVSPCGRLCAVGQSDAVSVWDTLTATLTQSLPNHTDPGAIFSECQAAFSANGILATTCGSHKVWMYSTSTWACVRVIAGHSDTVLSIAWSPCGRWLVSGSEDKSLRVWDTDSGSYVREVRNLPEWVTSVLVTRHRLVSAGRSFIRVWNRDADAPPVLLKDHSDIITDLVVTANERVFISCSADATVKVWCLASGICLHTIHLARKFVNSAIAVAGCTVAVMVKGADGQFAIRMWHLHTGAFLRDVRSPIGGLWANPRGLALSPCGSWVFASGECGIHVVSAVDALPHYHTNPPSGIECD